MEVGFIGAGAIANAIASHLVSDGHPVTLSNRRGPDTLKDQVAALGPLARAGTRAEAAAAPLVFLSVMWRDIDAALAGLPDWDGRILVDTTNQFDQAGGQYVPAGTRASFGVDTGSERDGGRLMQVGTGPLPGLHLLTQHADPAPREDARA